MFHLAVLSCRVPELEWLCIGDLQIPIFDTESSLYFVHLLTFIVISLRGNTHVPLDCTLMQSLRIRMGLY